MKTKHLLTGLVLPALFAACTAEEIESSKGVMTQEDLSARPSVGNVVLNFGNIDSRAELGDNSFNSIKFIAGEDAIGARIIDKYVADDTKDADGKNVAWKDYSIVDEYASSNYQYVYNDGKWETTALMVEGNYMFYFPYNAKNVARGPLEIITPTHQTIKPNEEGGERNAIAELYAGENPAFVGYKFIAAENQGLTQNVEMQHLFAYPQITLVNDFLVANKKGDKVETDLTISKVVFSADNLYEKYTIKHSEFRKNLTEKFSYLAKGATTATTLIEAGNWTDAESFLKKASIESITYAQAEGAKTVEITVEFEDGLELGFDEEYSFNVVLPATVYEGGDLTMKIYTDDDKMIGTKTIEGDETLYNEAFFDNSKKMTFAPGKRYSTQEYNFPNVGNPTPKKSAGNSGTYEISGDNLCLIDAVAPVAVINTIAEFEAFLETIDKNVNDLKEITKATERKANENNFILTPAYNEKGEKQDYANLVVDEAFLALLEEYNYDGTIEFVSKMHIKGAAEAPNADEDIEEFLLGNEDYSMTFAKAVVKEGFVTVNEYTAATELVVESGLVTVKGDDEESATIYATKVEGGEVKIKNANFDPSTVTASYKLNAAGTAVATTGKVTLDYTGETKAAKIEGHATLAGAGTLEIGSNVVISEMAAWTKGTVINNGKIKGNVTVPAAGTLTNNGKIEGTITNNGTINANKNMTVATNAGKIVVGDKKVELNVTAGAGKVDNTLAGKVNATANNVYATIASLKNNGVDANNNDVLAKYDSHSNIDRFVFTGEWEVDKNMTATDLATLKGKEIEFAAGSSLYVHNATLEMPGKVIVSADVNWSGRDADDATVKLSSDGIEYTQKANSTVYNNLTVTELTIQNNSGSSVNSQKLLLDQAASNGGAITLTENVELTAGYTLNKSLNLNLNGKTLNFNSNDILYRVNSGATLTISGGTVEGDGYVASSNVGGVVNVTSGTYTCGVTCFQSNGGELNISGGTFEAEPYNNVYYTINYIDAQNHSEKIKISGGTFYNFNPACSRSENPEDNFLAADKVVKVYENALTKEVTNLKPTTSGDTSKTYAQQPCLGSWMNTYIYVVE